VEKSIPLILVFALHAVKEVGYAIIADTPIFLISVFVRIAVKKI